MPGPLPRLTSAGTARTDTLRLGPADEELARRIGVLPDTAKSYIDRVREKDPPTSAAKPAPSLNFITGLWRTGCWSRSNERFRHGVVISLTPK